MSGFRPEFIASSMQSSFVLTLDGHYLDASSVVRGIRLELSPSGVGDSCTLTTVSPPTATVVHPLQVWSSADKEHVFAEFSGVGGSGFAGGVYAVCFDSLAGAPSGSFKRIGSAATNEAFSVGLSLMQFLRRM